MYDLKTICGNFNEIDARYVVLFYHDGRFHELRDAVEYMADISNLALTDAETDALVEYLRTF